MTPPRRRSRIALAAPMLLGALALTPLSAALLPSPAAADAPAAPILVTLNTLRPVAPQPGDTLVLTGSLHNISQADVTSLGLQLELGLSEIGTRGEFDEYADDPNGALPDTSMRPVDDVVDATEPTLPAGASEPFELTLTLNPDLLDLPMNTWEVRELGIAVTGTTAASVDIAPVGQLRTFLPWAPRASFGNGKPTKVAWIWPLIDRPHRTATSTWSDDALAPEISATSSRPGRLAGLLNAGNNAESQRPLGRHSTTQDVPVSWAIDPMLVSDVRAMTAGYRVATGATTTKAGTGTAAAKAWFAKLRVATSRSNAGVIALPYADPDIVAAVRAGFTTAIGVATATGRTLLAQALPGAKLLQYGWPPGGLADPRAINALSSYDDTSVVLSDIAVPVEGGPPSVTPSAHTIISTDDGTVDTILSDSGLDMDVDSGINNPNGERLSIQRFLAETLMIQAELPSVQRDVVVAPDRRWDPSPAYAAAILGDTGKVPWVQPTSLAAVQASPLYTNVQRKPLTYTSVERRAELPRSYLNRVAGVRDEIGAFSAILPTADPQTQAYTTALERALSSAWRDQPTLGRDQLSALSASVATQMGQVKIASRRNSYVTLTSHGGDVPVTIANNLGTPVQVTVQLQANQGRLALANNGRVDVPIPAHQQKLVHVHAAAKTSGVFPVRVRLLTPKGQPYGHWVPLFVRSTVYGTITLVITGAATAALMVTVAVRLIRRAMVARRSSPNAAT